MDPAGRLCHRGYAFTPMPVAHGWDVRIGDPAGHVADLELHRQLDQGPWSSPELALRAAEHYVDELLAEDSSY